MKNIAPSPAPDKSEAFDIAITYAFVHEVKVFAAEPDPNSKKVKAPLPGIRWKHEATREFASLERMWKKRPDAMTAMAAGKESGAYFVDVDPRNGGLETLAKLEQEHGPLPADTPRTRTAGGGFHVHLQLPEGVAIPKVDLGPGVQLIGCTADGEPLGYVIMPGSVMTDGSRYDWVGETPSYYKGELKLAPQKWAEHIEAIVRQRSVSQLNGSTPPVPPTSGPAGNADDAVADLAREAIELAATAEGGCNRQLNTAALRMGHHVAAGRLTKDAVREALREACITNGYIARDGEKAFHKTFNSGLKAGMKDPSQPRSKPDDDFGAGVPPADEALGTDLKWVDDQPLNSDITWMVGETIPDASIGFLAGESGAGKSFAMLDLAISLAVGESYFGRSITKRCGSYVLAGEGGYGIPRRIAAARTGKFKGTDASKLPIVYSDRIPNLLKPDARNDFIAHLRAVNAAMIKRYGVRLGILFIDTLAACVPIEDENSSRDAEKALAVMRGICAALDITVCAIHHVGKNESAGMRGSSAFRAGADFVLTVRGTKQRRLTLDKSRDAEEGPIGAFRLEFVTLGIKDDGTPVGACFVQPCTADETDPVADAKLTKTQRAFQQAFEAALAEHGEERATPAGDRVRMVQLEQVKAAFATMYSTTSDDERKAKNAVRMAFDRAIGSMSHWYRRDTADELEWIWLARDTGWPA